MQPPGSEKPPVDETLPVQGSGKLAMHGQAAPAQRHAQQKGGRRSGCRRLDAAAADLQQTGEKGSDSLHTGSKQYGI